MTDLSNNFNCNLAPEGCDCTDWCKRRSAAVLSEEMKRLVIAARNVAFETHPSPEVLKELDAASEAFASAAPWDEEPDPLGKRCPTCNRSWELFPPAKIDGEPKVRCVECKNVFDIPNCRKCNELVYPGTECVSRSSDCGANSPHGSSSELSAARRLAMAERILTDCATQYFCASGLHPTVDCPDGYGPLKDARDYIEQYGCIAAKSELDKWPRHRNVPWPGDAKNVTPTTEHTPQDQKGGAA